MTGAPLPLTPAAALARAFRLSNVGDSALTPDEVREKVLLLASALATVGPRERPAVLAYVERLRVGEDPSDEDAAAAALLKGALLQLTSPQLARLQELHDARFVRPPVGPDDLRRANLRAAHGSRPAAGPLASPVAPPRRRREGRVVPS